MRTLVLYDATQTYTNTLYEHLRSFCVSKNEYAFCHYSFISLESDCIVDFDAIIVHYSVRLPYDAIAVVAPLITSYSGLKVLFIQDEYEHTRRAWHWIKTIGFDLVFTVVPEGNIAAVYPPDEFSGVRFVSNLTGYVPDLVKYLEAPPPPSKRTLAIGYRGRPLALRYGALGTEKVGIGQMVKAYCDLNGIQSDIAWGEGDRIYGDAWYAFMARCRAMLGSESGSNVFDWDGDLETRVAAYRAANPGSSDRQVYAAVIEPIERPGLMNQLSPKVFEAIAMRTVLVLFEGNYSGVIQPWKHYIPVAKDGHNLDEVFERLRDDAFVDEMAQQAYDHVIGSGSYSYASFVAMVETEMKARAAELSKPLRDGPSVTRLIAGSKQLTAEPLREPPVESLMTAITRATSVSSAFRRASLQLWIMTPPPVRTILRGPLKRIFAIVNRLRYGA